MVSFSGAAGTLASLGEHDGLATQSALAKELDLDVPDITWHTIRDNFAELTGLLAMIAASIGKIGYDIMLMMQTEIGEVLEPFVPGRGASSTMPQKRNPISSEMMLAAAKIVREQHCAMLDAVVQDHERATGQWHVEWQVIPTAFIVTSGGLRGARDVLEGLEVRPAAMRKGLEVSGGLIVAEAVMMGLAPRIGRQTAHEAVYDACRESLTSAKPFIDALVTHPSIGGKLDRATLERLVDPANYLGAAPAMTRRLLARRVQESA
jgi:3-carboxy-cis,cis-muconate cycloisomerase